MKVLFIFGTRPEGIKLAPVISCMKQDKSVEAIVCNTGQHLELIAPILKFFKISPDYSLNVMKRAQSLNQLVSVLVSELDKVIKIENPDVVLVQGDTSSAFAGALAAFQNRIPVGHIEAGLRSGNLLSPFPEEANRKMIGSIAQFHFTPTVAASMNLKMENIDNSKIFNVGNTVIDALLAGINIFKEDKGDRFNSKFEYLDFTKPIVLVTAHRRENAGLGFENICNAIKELSSKIPDIQVVFPVHYNPIVRKPVNNILNNIKNVYIIEPLEYHYLIFLMSKSYLIMTDSGGIQEEAPSLGKPVLVLRDNTERKEGITAGTAILVGTNKDFIVTTTLELFNNRSMYQKMSSIDNPYGDGKSSERILNLLKTEMSKVY